MHLHRRFGWIALGYMPVLLIVGAWILFRMMRNAAVPPFWTYACFMAMNLMSLFAFAALAIAAIVWRRQTQWHRRLVFCAMAALVITPVNRPTPDAVLAQYMSLGSAPTARRRRSITSCSICRPDDPGRIWLSAIRSLSASESVAGPCPRRWNGRRQRQAHLVRRSASRYHALQLHCTIEGATS